MKLLAIEAGSPPKNALVVIAPMSGRLDRNWQSLI